MSTFNGYSMGIGHGYLSMFLMILFLSGVIGGMFYLMKSLVESRRIPERMQISEVPKLRSMKKLNLAKADDSRKELKCKYLRGCFYRMQIRLLIVRAKLT